MNPDIDSAAAFDRKWSKMLDKLDISEREMIDRVIAGAEVNYTAAYMVGTFVLGVLAGIAAMTI